MDTTRVSTDKTKGGKRKGRKRTPRQGLAPGVKCTPIAVSGQFPIVSLQATYGVIEDGVTRIDGRTPEAQRAKDRFQNDAYRYAHTLGQALAVYGGFTGQRVARNRGSQLDAGSVMASYVHPDCPYWLSVYIESDHTKCAIPRPDGVIIIACRREVQRGRQRERLHYLNPAQSSLQLAQVLLLLVGLKQAGDLGDQVDHPAAAGLQRQALFDEPAVAAAPSIRPGEGHGTVVRVWLLGAYRQCVLLEPGRMTVEVVCIDDHPHVALAYWGKRFTKPLLRVHPDDRALCAPPGQAHPAPGNQG